MGFIQATPGEMKSLRSLADKIALIVETTQVFHGNCQFRLVTQTDRIYIPLNARRKMLLNDQAGSIG